MPPTEITQKSASGTASRTSRSTASERAFSGAPDSPPSPAAATTAGSVDETLSRDRRVRGDEAGEPETDRQFRDRGHLVVGEIGRDLDEQRRRPGGVAHGLEQRPQRLDRLQSAQTRGVRR